MSSATSTESLRVIIVGGGRVGFRAGRLLDGYGHEVTVIEKDPARCEEISEHLPNVLEADATLPPVLREAGPETSDAIAALTENGGTNLAVCLAAQRMNETIHTVLRTDTETRSEYGEFVDTVVYPEGAGARLIANDIARNTPRALNALIGDLEILQVRVETGAPAAGKRLDEEYLPDGCLVLTGQKGDHVAQADTVLEPGHEYTIATNPEVLDEVIELLQKT
jgi:trk system potassium uptake protein